MKLSMKRQRKFSALPFSWKVWLSGWLLFSSISSQTNFTEARIHDKIVDDIPYTLDVPVSQQGLLTGDTEGQAATFSFQEFVDLAYDVASIDQDLKQIGQLLRNGNFDGARRLYEEGSHSASYAHILLDEPLQEALPAGSIVTGPANGDEDTTTVKGIVHETVRPGERQLKIRYISEHTNNSRSTSSVSEVRQRSRSASKQSLIKSKVKFSEKSKRHRDDRNNQDMTGQASVETVNKDHFCYVGGSPEPITDGCLKASGTLTMDALGRDYGYRYDVLNENYNARSISKLSKEVDPSASQMLSKEFFHFSSYFGRSDYADHLIQTAFDALVNDPTATTDMERSNLHFYHFNDDALVSFLYTLMAHMTLWMETVVHLDAAIESCPSARQESIQQWDEAVAMYLGSRGTRGSILQYKLAAKQCQAFRTCAPDRTEVRVTTFAYEDGEEHINQEIATYFQVGRQALLGGDCGGAKSRKAKIVRSMTIPLIQATLLEAYKVEQNGDDNYIMGPDASAIAYGLTILPLINDCSVEDANALSDALGDLHTPASFWAVGSASTKTSSKNPLSFSNVKQILEKNYSCMKIKCSDVGGIWNFNSNQYMEGAEPCNGNASPSGNDDPSLSINAATSTGESGESEDEPGFFVFFMILVGAGFLVLGTMAFRVTKERMETRRRIEANRKLRAERAKYCRDTNIEITLNGQFS